MRIFRPLKKFKTQMGYAKINDPLKCVQFLRRTANGFLSHLLFRELTAKSP